MFLKMQTRNGLVQRLVRWIKLISLSAYKAHLHVGQDPKSCFRYTWKGFGSGGSNGSFDLLKHSYLLLKVLQRWFAVWHCGESLPFEVYKSKAQRSGSFGSGCRIQSGCYIFLIRRFEKNTHVCVVLLIRRGLAFSVCILCSVKWSLLLSSVFWGM